MTLSMEAYLFGMKADAIPDYNWSDPNPTKTQWMQDDLKSSEWGRKIAAHVGKCWTVYASYMDGAKIDDYHHTPPFLRVVNFPRCTIADIYEGTRDGDNIDVYEIQQEPEKAKREGKWLGSLTDSFKGAKKPFMEEYCGNPTL